MSEVTRVEAMSLLRELKEFAFDSNHDFKNGLLSETEIQRAFSFTTVVNDFENNEYSSNSRLLLGFNAQRSERVRQKPSYIYSLFSTAERTINAIPLHVVAELDESDLALTEEIDEDALTESSTVTLGTSTYESGKIDISYSYDICAFGETIYERDDEDVLYGEDGEFVSIDPDESDDGMDKIFVMEPIEQESLPSPAERAINEMAFRAIVNPLDQKYNDNVINYREAHDKMRDIMQALRTGRNIQALFDL